MRSLLRMLAVRIRAMFSRRRNGDDFSDEIREHLNLLTEENERRGMTLAEARREARIRLGGAAQLRETHRELTGIPFIETFVQDVRFALRMLSTSPAFTAVAVLTLALGIGANTAIFSLIDPLVFRSLPVHQPDKVVFLVSTWKNGGVNTAFSHPDFVEIRKQTGAIFSDVAAMQNFHMDGLSVNGKSRPMWAAYVTGNFFALLGVKPAVGRLILPSEGNAVGADANLVLSYSFWKSQFDSDADVIGKKASINGHPVTIVGVAPAGFHGPSSFLDIQGYIPLGMASTLNDAPANFLTDPKNSSMTVIARVRQGVSLGQTQPALAVISQRLGEQYHNEMTVGARPLTGFGLFVSPGHPEIMPLMASVFLILAGAVLVLACMNIANLCMVRARMRQREISLRAALGATRGRLVRQLLTESLLLASLGCFAGVVLGTAASRLFSSIGFHTALPLVLDFRFDWRVFTYALAAAVVTGAIVGIAPALRAARANLNDVLHEGGRTSTGGHRRPRNALVVAQVGGSLMLLVVAGLFLRSLQRALHTDLGFDPQHLLNLSIDPHEAGYNEAQAREFQQRLLARARGLPGVLSASLAAAIPMSYNGYSDKLKIDGYQPPMGQNTPAAGFNIISPGYLTTMRIPLLRGRDFRDSDGQNSQRVAIVNQAFADRFWHGLDPIGRHFSFLDDTARTMEVIGVAKNSYEQDIFSQVDVFFYVPVAQHANSYITLQLRTPSAPEAMAVEATSLVHSLEPMMPVFDVQPMTTALETANGFLPFRFAAALAASLGTLGVILAVVGLYGVISYAAGQRTHEIGIRMALGAQRRQILRMILGQGIVIVGVGVFVGLLAATVMAKLVGNLLFGVPSIDVPTYIGASLLLTGIALSACYIPARRAMRVDPMVALRYE